MPHPLPAVPPGLWQAGLYPLPQRGRGRLKRGAAPLFDSSLKHLQTRDLVSGHDLGDTNLITEIPYAILIKS
jgi:hypothetical protein